MNSPKFYIFRSAVDLAYYYHLKTGNGEKILSGEGYHSKQGCLDGIASVRQNALDDARYQRNGPPTYTFNLKGSNGEIIGRSETYYSAAGRENGITAVKRSAPLALIEDNVNQLNRFYTHAKWKCCERSLVPHHWGGCDGWSFSLDSVDHSMVLED